MKQKATLWTLVACGALALGFGCGKSAGSTGSNTNWLQRCETDSECPAHAECWCHACTTVCVSPSDCRSGTCAATAEVGCGVASSNGPSVCVEPCTEAADCSRLGTGLDCVNGACLPPAAGTGGSSAGNGGNGAAAEGGAGANGVAGSGAAGSGAAGNDSGGGGEGGNDAGGNGAESGASGAGGPPVGGTLEPAGARLSVAEMYACAVVSRETAGAPAGALWCWGDGPFGRNGVIGGQPGQSMTPGLMAGIADVVGVAVSDEHSCALTAAGDVYCWGRNEVGQLGGPSAPEGTCSVTIKTPTPDYPCQPAPTRVKDVSGAVRIAVSPGRSCALLADGSLRCWGDVEAFSSWADAVTDARSLAVGVNGACVTTLDKKLSCSFPIPISEPIPALELVVMANVLGDWNAQFPDQATRPRTLDFACALGSDGQVRCFGDDSAGELGDGPAELAFVPALGDAKELSLGAAHACALGADEQVRCWGANQSGAVGSPALTSYACAYRSCETSPREVFGLPRISTLAAGGNRTCAIATDDSIWCWGDKVLGNGAMRVRVLGPWDGDSELCQTSRPAPIDGSGGIALYADHDCFTDHDCIEVPLDLSCARSCAYESVSRAGAAALTQGLADLESDQCPSFLSADCSSPALRCDTHATRPVCMQGYCTQDDPAHNDCEDGCGCEATRQALYTLSYSGTNNCSGFDLWPIVGIACGTCQSSSVAVVIGNAGSEVFRGDAVLSFESLNPETDPVTFPGPITVALELAPGEASEPIHVLSRGQGMARMRVTADGDCESLNDDYSSTAIPSPTNPCE